MVMNVQWLISALVLFLNAIAALFIAILLMRIPPASGKNCLALMLVMLAFWNLGDAMIIGRASPLEVNFFWLRFKNIGVQTAPPLWFLVTLQYMRLDSRLNKFTGALFFIIPLVTLSFIFSNNWIEYYYAAVRVYSENGGPLIVQHGFWYFYSTAYAYLLHACSIILLLWRAAQYGNIYRRQSFILLSAALLPAFANVFFQIGFALFPRTLFIHIDLTPVAFTATAALLAFGVFGLRVFDLTPIARDAIMESIPKIVFTLDAHNRVVDANAAALQWLEKSAREIIGKDSEEAFRDCGQLKNYLIQTDETYEIIHIPISAEQPRALEVTVSLLYDDLDNFQGRVILIRDISDYARLKEALMLRLENETKALTSDMNFVADEMFELLSPDSNAEFIGMVTDGLRNFHNVKALGQSPLADYIGAIGNDNALRGKNVQRVLREAIESLRPEETRPAEPIPRNWHSYLVLHDAYLRGVDNREIRMRLRVSEGMFYRTRRNAVQSVARWLIEKKNKKLE